MADTFQLEIVTPEKLIVKTSAEEVQIPGADGYLGVLAGHAPLITELSAGELTYRSGTEMQYFAVASGFAEVLPDRVIVLAESAERPAEIDVARAQESKQRAEKLLFSGDPQVDYTRAELAVRRAETRIAVAAEKH